MPPGTGARGPLGNERAGAARAGAAPRVPDDHVVVIPNYVRIREINLDDPDFLASPNYKQEAVDRGWHATRSGRLVTGQAAPPPRISEGSLSRLWLIYSTIAPGLKNWPERRRQSPAGPRTLYSQEIEGAAFYSFSVKPEKKLSVRDIIAFQRSLFEDTIYDMTWDPAWMVSGGGGRVEKSPMASPFIPGELEAVLRIRHHRTIASQGYGMVAQLRSWLPDEVGGVYWFYVDNPFVSAYVPIYAAVTDVSPLYKNYDFERFSEDSARWAVDVVEKLMLLRWQPAVADLRAARDPLEESFFSGQEETEKKAQEMLKKNPSSARKFLTGLTIGRMEQVVKMYRSLRATLLAKYSGDSY